MKFEAQLFQGRLTLRTLLPQAWGVFFYRLVYDRGKKGDAAKGVTFDLMDIYIYIYSQMFSIHADSGVCVCMT